MLLKAHSEAEALSQFSGSWQYEILFDSCLDLRWVNRKQVNWVGQKTHRIRPRIQLVLTRILPTKSVSF